MFDNAVEAAIIAYEGPIVSIPILGSVVQDIEEGFADALYNKLKGQIVLETALFVDAEHRRVFDSAQTGLKKIALEKGVDSEEFKAAHELEKQALKKMGQFNVVQPGITG